MRSPMLFPTPTNAAYRDVETGQMQKDVLDPKVHLLTTSNSKSIFLDWEKYGSFVAGSNINPEGRLMGVPVITTDDARPWYPTGK